MNAHLCISTRTNKYFPQAESFMPERWLRNDDNNELSSKNVNPFVSLPFGFGPRSCIGQRFAVMEMEVALAKVTVSRLALGMPYYITAKINAYFSDHKKFCT